MSVEDAGVVVVGAATAAYPWWEPWVSWVPDTVQGAIVTATLIFVVARAVNEVRKFFRSEKE